MKITAHNVLMTAFGYYEHGNDPDAYPFVMRLVDWEKALQIQLESEEVDKEQGKGIGWKLFLEVGFLKDRVLQAVDPVLRPLVSRLLDLPILTLGSCAGHPGREEDNYLCLVFCNSDFGSKFLKSCQEVFAEWRHLRVWGEEVEALWSERSETEKASKKFFRVPLPLDFCIKKRLSITFRWKDLSSPEELSMGWRLFSRVVDQFDQKGEYVPSPEAFSERFSLDEYPGLHKEVLEQLFAFGAQHYPHGGMVGKFVSPEEWNRRFGVTNGEAIVSFLEPLRRKTVQLAPRIPDLEARVYGILGILGMGCKGVKVVSIGDENRLREVLGIEDVVCENLLGSLRGILGNSPAGEAVLKCSNEQGDWALCEKETFDFLSDHYFGEQCAMIEDDLPEAFFDMRPPRLLKGDFIEDGLPSAISGGFCESILSAIEALLSGLPNEAEKLISLTELFFVGNFPVGVLADGSFLVLTA